eukprot:scaffold118958_cov32-Prasinocladus_malaysianus.AAC.1
MCHLCIATPRHDAASSLLARVRYGKQLRPYTRAEIIGGLLAKSSSGTDECPRIFAQSHAAPRRRNCNKTARTSQRGVTQIIEGPLLMTLSGYLF